MRLHAEMQPLSIPAIRAVHMHNLMLMIGASTFNDNSGQLASFQTPCVNTNAVIGDLEAAFRVMSVYDCTSVRFVEGLLEFVPNLLNYQQERIEEDTARKVVPSSTPSHLSRRSGLRP